MKDLMKVVNELSAPAYMMLVVAVASTAYNLVMDMNVPVMVVTLLSVALAVYNDNCLVVGNCDVWAWVVASLYVVGVVADFYNRVRK